VSKPADLRARVPGRPFAEVLDMRNLLSLVFVLSSIATFGACTTDDSGSGTGSGDSDFSFCQPTPIDDNGDGIADGLDLNCDGVIDIRYGGGGGGGGGSSNQQCTTMTSVNGVTESIHCTSSGGAATCECRVNGTLEQTCSEPTTTCSIGVPNGNCCGF
jgi:hypothetical protein